MVGCVKIKQTPAESVAVSSNPEIQVELMLTHDGIKVYRFLDGYHYVYFTDARGSTEWAQQDGKVQVPVRVETVR